MNVRVCVGVRVCVCVGWLLGTDKSKFTCASLLSPFHSGTRRTSVTDLTCYACEYECVCVYVCVCIRQCMYIYICAVCMYAANLSFKM